MAVSLSMLASVVLLLYGRVSAGSGDWVTSGDYQYLLAEHRMSWNDALSFCQQQEPTAFLARPTSANVDFLKTFGYADIYLADHHLVQNRWRWSDGSALPTDVTWLSGYPKFENLWTPGVFYRSSGKLMNTDPGNLFPVVCQAPLDVTTTSTPSPCPTTDGWIDLQTPSGLCYYFSSADPAAKGNVTWFEALNDCKRSHNASLAVVPHAGDFYPLVYRLTHGGNDVWMGLRQAGGERSWEDGTPYRHELDQFVAGSGSGGVYGFVSAKDMMFDLSDGSEKRPYACSFDPNPQVQPQPRSPALP